MAKLWASMMATDFVADPDPAFHFEADPNTDPAFRKYADPDPQKW